MEETMYIHRIQRTLNKDWVILDKFHPGGTSGATDCVSNTTHHLSRNTNIPINENLQSVNDLNMEQGAVLCLQARLQGYESHSMGN
jgi:hypothetical protein